MRFARLEFWLFAFISERNNAKEIALIISRQLIVKIIGVRAGGARGAAAPPKFGQLRFFGQHEKIWAKPVFKGVSMFLVLS